MFIWTINDAIQVILLALFALVFLAITLGRWWEQKRCPHDGGVNETMACDAICQQCGKNLGFIGAWRDRQRASDINRE